MQQSRYHSADSPSDQAIEWLARLRADDVTPEETADFATWLASSSLNKVAFDEATELWHQLQHMSRQSAPSPLPLRYRRYSRMLPLATAASFLVACIFIVLQLNTPGYATGKGEQRRVVLEDGSTAYLNTLSEIRVSYSRDTRRVEVSRGEVWFDVAKLPDRPFVVVGQYASAQAVGTAFTVRETPGFTQIGVTEGVVAVSDLNRDASTLQPHLLRQGQQSTVSTAVTDFQPYDADTALSWRRGQLIYEDVRLSELVADLNRYLPKTMAINDDVLADRRVTAVLYLDDQDAMLEALDKTVPIRWKTWSDSLIIITSDL